MYAWIKRGNIGNTGSILGQLPYICLEWLRTGKGPMMILDETNIHLVPGNKYAGDSADFIKPKIAARIEPGNEQARQRIRRQTEKDAEKASPGDTEQFNITEMIIMSTRVLESETVYRSALASNVRAFYQAVIKEEEMQSVNETLETMQRQNEEMAERMERMEQMLLSFGAQVPEKREQGNG